MSDSDSFIDEVSEEVRRERLFGLFRRYGWIAALAVVVIVAGASFNEYRKAQQRAVAEAAGDSILTALEQEDPQARAAALADVAAPDAAGAVVTLMRAAELMAADDAGAAADILRPLAGDPEAPVVYSDLAALKLVLIGDAGEDAATRAQLLDRLAAPGAPYRMLAREQQALALVADGQHEAALEAALALVQEQGITAGLRQRLAQLVIALGGDLPMGPAG